MANLNEILKMDKKTNDIGIYKLTPVEAFLINKNLPYGIKLITDTEYNRKYSYLTNKKKILLNQKINRRTKEINSNKKNKETQIDENIEIKKVKDNYIKLIYKGKSHINFNFIIKCKCLIFLYQLSTKFELEPIFIYNKPSIRDIENNVFNGNYDSFFQFKLSIRKFWLYFFQKEKNKIDQVKKLCKFSEEEFKNIDKLNEDIIIKIYNSLLIDENTSLFQVKTISSSLTNESNSVVNNQGEGKNVLVSPINIKDNSIVTNDSLLNDEKNILCEKIKSLTPSQLQGIIPLLSDFFGNINNSTDKYVEFDIELLNKEQTEKVEKYVDKCIEYNNNYNIDKINNNNIKIIDNYNNNINDNNNDVDNKLKNKRKILLETPSSKNLNSINNEDIKKNIEITNDDENDDNNLNLKYNEGNNIPNNIKSNKENYKKNNTYNYNNNDNNIIFTENSILNQNKSLDQSKIETNTLFNPLVVSDKNLTNSPNVSLNYYVNKTSPQFSQKSNQLNFESESFDIH